MFGKGASLSLPAITSKKPRKPVTNVRHEKKQNKMTKVGKSGIHYSDDVVIGHGQSAIVYTGFYQSLDKKAAVKRVLSQYAEISKREIEIWLQVTEEAVRKENVNIVQLYHWTPFQEGDIINYYFAMEMATGDLEKILKEMVQNKDKNWRAQVVGYLKDVSYGIDWLHSKRVIHRDIKPENILIFCCEGRTMGSPGIAKLGDFGVSKSLSAVSRTGTQSMANGTVCWMAPEAIRARNRGETFYSTKALDIFSLGMTGHYALTKGEEHPFAESVEYRRFVEMNILDPDVKPKVLLNEEHVANHLFQWMMSYVPNGRLNTRQLLHHPLFWSTKRTLGFLVDVAKSVDNKNDTVSAQWKKKLDEEYLLKHPSFNWMLSLGTYVSTYIFQRRATPTSTASNGRGKKGGGAVGWNKLYNDSSVSSLLKLIRDKDVHHTDMVDELITQDYFGVENAGSGEWFYSEEKYCNYFCEKFPDLLIFLFIFLVKNVSQPKILDPVKWKYGVKEFHCNIPDV